MEPIRSQEGLGQFSEAFAVVRWAKNVFWWVLLLCLLVQLAGFVLVRFTNYVALRPGQTASTPAKQVQLSEGTPVAASGPATRAASTAPSAEPSPAAMATLTATCPTPPWYHVFRFALPATMFLCVIVGLLLIMTMMWVVKLTLLARASGVEGYMSGFFWSLIFWVLVLPWQHALRNGSFVGATFSLHELLDRTNDILSGTTAGRMAEAFYYARFAAYPAIALIVLLIVQSKFAAGYKRMTATASPDVTTFQTPTTPKL